MQDVAVVTFGQHVVGSACNDARIQTLDGHVVQDAAKRAGREDIALDLHLGRGLDKLKPKLFRNGKAAIGIDIRADDRRAHFD